MNLKFHISIFAVLFMLYICRADTVWTDASYDHSWENSANWNSLSVPTIDSGTVIIKAGSISSPKAYPSILSSVPKIYRLTIGSDGNSQASLNVRQGGSLEVEWILRLGHYSSIESDVEGRLFVQGGEVAVSEGGYIDVGNLNTDGALTIESGSVTSPIINIPASRNSNGIVTIKGGALNVGYYGLNITNDSITNRTGKIDIAGGMIIVDGDNVALLRGYVSQEAIIGYGGNSTLSIDYDQTFPGKTTIVADSYDPMLSRVPNPANGKTEVPVKGRLKWIGGNWAQQHDIYIGDDYRQVLMATDKSIDLTADGIIQADDLIAMASSWLDNNAIAADYNNDGTVNFNDYVMLAYNYGKLSPDVYKGRLSQPEYAYEGFENNKKYYWRVDAFNSGLVWKGDVWEFKSKVYVDDKKDGWTLTFSDEFNGDDIDWQIWGSESGYPTHIESSRWPDNVKVEDGMLRLLTKKESRGGADWTTAHIWTREFKQRYGYWEARYRIAGASGLNNAFWMIKGGGFEIDIDEGHYPNKVNTNLHNWDGEHWSSQMRYEAQMPLSEGFYTRALEWTSTELIYYFNGEQIRRFDHTQTPAYVHDEVEVRLSTAVLHWAGEITDALDGTSMDVDYVRVYTKNMQASNPIPADDSVGVSRFTSLSWQVVENSNSAIYFGTDYNSVLEANSDSFEFMSLQSETEFVLNNALNQGQTYYWRIDLIDQDQNITKGEVWSFEVFKPSDMLISPSSLLATAFNTSQYGQRQPVNAVNGSGLNEENHSTTADLNMWMADQSAGWFKISLNGSYQLDYMKFWNFNMAGYLNRGIKDADIYYSNSLSDPGNLSGNPANWTLLTSKTFTMASGRSDYGMNSNYAMPDIVDMQGIEARWILLDIKNNHGGNPYLGISEIQLIQIP